MNCTLLFCFQAFDIRRNYCKDILPKKMNLQDKETADDILDNSPLKNERDPFENVNPGEVCFQYFIFNCEMNFPYVYLPR